MKPDPFMEKVVQIYRKEFKNLGFIPNKRLQQYRQNKYGQFFINDDGFVLVGSLHSEITPIYAVYVYPEKRNGSIDKVIGLLRLLPRKSYRVRCHFGQTFWKRAGLTEIKIENTNQRKRDIYVLEGTFNQLITSFTGGF